MIRISAPQPPSWPARLALLVAWAVAAACATPADPAAPSSRYVTPSVESVLTGCDAAAAPQRWAVVVGVNAYRDPRIADLSGAVNDAWSFYHYLASPEGGKVPATRLKLLLNDQATRSNVVGALGQFLAQACPQDQVIIYFAGHGAPEPERPEDAFLLVHDTEVENLVGTAVSMNKLPDFLEWRAGRVGRLLMFVDACHSGAVQFPGARGARPTERIQLTVKSVEAVVAERKGWGAVSAAASDQFAQETPCTLGGQTYPGGLFTCHLLDGLSGSADLDHDGAVTLDELTGHLTTVVSRDSGGQQLPQRSGTLEGELVLAQPSGAPVPIPLVPERYQLDEEPASLDPLLWSGAGLTGLALLNGLVFQLVANSTAGSFNDTTATNPGSRTQDQVEAERQSHARLVDVSRYSYLAGGALALATGVTWLVDLVIEPQDIDDVYLLPPWFQLQLSPDPRAALTLTLSWE